MKTLTAKVRIANDIYMCIDSRQLEGEIKHRLAHDLAHKLMEEITYTEKLRPAMFGYDKEITAEITLVDEKTLKDIMKAADLLRGIK